MTQYTPNGDGGYLRGINVNAKCPDVDTRKH